MNTTTTATTMKTIKTRLIGLGTLALMTLTVTLLPTLPAGASRRQAEGPKASMLARDHWRAVAEGDVPAVMAGYGPAAALHWDGGVFDGDHAGLSALQTVWSRFSRMRAPLRAVVGNVEEQGGGGDSRIVTARVVFANHDWTYPVLSRLVFRQGRIVDETWHIATPEDEAPEGWRIA